PTHRHYLSLHDALPISLAIELSVGFGKFYKPAESRLNQLLGELPKLQAEVVFLNAKKLSADDVLHEANSLYERWPSLKDIVGRRSEEHTSELQSPYDLV